jgi:hypothetical protein
MVQSVPEEPIVSATEAKRSAEELHFGARRLL